MNIKTIKNNLKDMDRGFLGLCLFFLIFGLLNIVTASSREAVSLEVTIYHYFVQHLKMILIGLAGAFVVIQIPTAFYKKTIFYLWFFVLLLILFTFTTEAKRGAYIWLEIGGFSFQPGEFSKPLMIVGISVLFEQFITLYNKNKQKAMEVIPKIFIMALVIPFILILQRDLGNMGIMVLTFLFMFIASPIAQELKKKAMIIFGGLMGIFIIFQLISGGSIFKSYQLSRFNFSEPCKRYEKSGYQICNAYIAINDGGFFGLGIGKSKQKYSYIPEPHTDMIFAITAEEYGSLVVGGIFTLYALIFAKLHQISKKASTIRGKYIAFGAMCYIFIQMFVNLGGLIGMIPLTGVTLPFLSYGGSFTISLIMMIGLVLRVTIETKNQKIKIRNI